MSKSKSPEDRQITMINVNDFVNNQLNLTDISAIPKETQEDEEGVDLEFNLNKSRQELKYLRSTTPIMNQAKAKEYIKCMSSSLNPSGQKRPHI